MKLALKLPFLGRRAKDAPVAAQAEPAKSRSWLARPLPLIGRLSTAKQLQVLTTGLVLFLVVDAAVVAYDTRQGTFATLYVSTVGKIRMLSQRLAKAAQQSSQGNREAFKQLRDSRDEFAKSVKLLQVGGIASGVDVPASPQGVRTELEKLDKEWQKTEKNAGLVIAEERNLVALGEAVRQINANNPALLELADEISALSVQLGGTVRQNAITSQLVMLTQRMAKNANTMLAGDIVDPEVAFLLGKDTNTFRDTLQALLNGNEGMRIGKVTDADMRAKLVDLETGFKQYQKAVAEILGNMQRLVNAKRATRDIFNDSETLLKA
ncbi:MAG TPA: type IV pili methyl-accepting chemotaxis transducer N-terminal domain-containing protein, partial [Burkholderiales bacterium]|nr:type IV pili methyl-accepting chemotaxis transducer N-terminal domain-containing protein [Burkholderiales bacterium]